MHLRCSWHFSMDDDGPGLMLVVIRPGESAKVERHPILLTKQIEAAYNHFFKQGISMGPIQSDSGGNRFFEFQDLEGNKIEVCTGPK
jgi:hypothetical protein